VVEESLSFEQVLEEFKPMVHHLIHRLGILDPHEEFYQEGLLALWEVSQTYDQEKGKLSSFAYFIIRNRLISLIRKKNKKQEQTEEIVAKSRRETTIGPHDFDWDPYLYQEMVGKLSENQQKWFDSYVIQDLSVKEIAVREGVTVDAVKNWGRLAKRKLMKDSVVMEYVGKG